MWNHPEFSVTKVEKVPNLYAWWSFEDKIPTTGSTQAVARKWKRDEVLGSGKHCVRND
jgi:hypothetical protein